MDAFIAYLAVLIIIIALPCVFFKPVFVFYLMVFSTIFGRIFYASIFNMNNLGAPRAWQPADFLFFLTLFAVPFTRRELTAEYTIGRRIMWIIFILFIISTIQGILTNNMTSVLPAWRRFYFIAPMIFAMKYFDSYKKVNHFLLVTGLLLISMLFYHLLLRFGVITLTEAFRRNVAQLEGGRGELMLAPVLYIALIGMGLMRISSGQGRTWFSTIMILAGLSGIALTESRTLHGAVAVILILLVLFQRGKIKNTVLAGGALILVLLVAANIGFNIFQRWHAGPRGYQGGIRLDTWRAQEYSSILNSYSREPYLLFTGRGVGSMHDISTMSIDRPSSVSYFHSEFLGWFDTTGLIGMTLFVFLFLWTIWIGFRLSSSRLLFLEWYGGLCFLIGSGLFLHSIFSPSFMNYSASSVYACLFVLMANWRVLYESVRYDFPEELIPAESADFYDLSTIEA